MNSQPVAAGLDRSWFALDAQKKPVDEKQFLAGLEMLTKNLAKPQRRLVAHVLRQLRGADLKSWPHAEQAGRVAKEFFKAWPKLKIGSKAAHFSRDFLETISPKFEAMLRTDMIENQASRIALKAPENREVASSVLRYLLNGKIPPGDGNAIHLLRFACQHRIEPLMRDGEAYLARHVSFETCNELLDLALDENLTLIQCALLNFIQKNRADPALWCVDMEKRGVGALADNLEKYHLRLSVSPENQPALTLGEKFDVKDSHALKLLREVNQRVGIKYLDVRHPPKIGVFDLDLGLDTLGKIGKALPDVEELIADLKTSVGVSKLKNVFPKLRSFGTRAPLPEHVAIEDYLRDFAPPGQEASASGRPRLRALDLSLREDLTEGQVGQLSTYFEELYELTIVTNHLVALNLPKQLSSIAEDAKPLKHFLPQEEL